MAFRATLPSMHRTALAFGLTLLLGLANRPVAFAQAALPTVIVAVESGNGLPSAEALRTALAGTLGVRMVLQREVLRSKLLPDALLSISVDRDHNVSVLYWDRNGQPDALSAPVVAARDRIDTVVMTLVAALLQRHLPELAKRPEPDDIDMRAVRDGHARALWTSQEVYAALTRLGLLQRRTSELSFEDF